MWGTPSASSRTRLKRLSSSSSSASVDGLSASCSRRAWPGALHLSPVTQQACQSAAQPLCPSAAPSRSSSVCSPLSQLPRSSWVWALWFSMASELICMCVCIAYICTYIYFVYVLIFILHTYVCVCVCVCVDVCVCVCVHKYILEKEVATTPVFLPRVPGTEEPGGLQSMVSQRVRHDLVTEHGYI